MKPVKTIAWFSVLGGLILHLSILVVIRVEGPLQPSLPESSAEVRYVGQENHIQGEIYGERALLLDSAPLFMPTRWNAVSEMSKVASLRELTEIFDPYAASIQLSEVDLAFPETSIHEITPALLLPPESDFVLSRFEQSPLPAPSVASGRVSVSIRSAGGREIDMPSGLYLPEPLQMKAPRSLWPPVRCYLHIRQGRPVGTPMLAQRSGILEWDNALKRHFQTLDFYHCLADGYYLVQVFP